MSGGQAREEELLSRPPPNAAGWQTSGLQQVGTQEFHAWEDGPEVRNSTQPALFNSIQPPPALTKTIYKTKCMAMKPFFLSWPIAQDWVSGERKETGWLCLCPPHSSHTKIQMKISFFHPLQTERVTWPLSSSLENKSPSSSFKNLDSIL